MLYKALQTFDGKLYYKELTTPYRALQLLKFKCIGGIFTSIQIILSVVNTRGGTLHTQPIKKTKGNKYYEKRNANIRRIFKP